MSQTTGNTTHLSPSGSTQRQRILDLALSLMSQRGVDGTSMRDLASAASLNVASLYHYFPSKRDLLIAVLKERGVMSDVGTLLPPTDAEPEGDLLTGMLQDIFTSILDLEDFVRLMLGEVMRGEETAHEVGVELMTATQDGLEAWLIEHEPAMCESTGAAAVARLLRAMVVGLFIEYAAGMMTDDGDPKDVFRRRADEVVAVLRSPH